MPSRKNWTREDYNAYYRNYYKTHPEQDKKRKIRSKENYAKWYEIFKLGSMRMVSKSTIPKCIYCKCDDLRILQINHKNLGGTRERKNNKLTHLYRDIYCGRRKTDDLEVTCIVCNMKHYAEKKFGLHFKVEFIGLGLPEILRKRMCKERFKNASLPVQNWSKRAGR